MNITAILLWAILALSGYLLSSSIKGALVGLLIGLIVSFLAEIFLPRR
jgi:multisubunit Na+/H+ antiporter MnhE subunit